MNYLSKKFFSADFEYYSQQSFVEDREPKVSVYEKGFIIPYGYGCDAGLYTTPPINNTPVNPVHEKVIYCGEMQTGHYGNVLIDYLSRMWWSDSECAYCAYVSCKEFSSDDPVFRLLSFLGFPRERVIRVSTPTQFDSVYVPEKTFLHTRFVLPSFQLVFDKMYQNMSPRERQRYDKVYLTRTHLNKHKEVGEKRFELFFARNGYIVIAPEELSIEDQAQLFRTTRVIASLEGTHAHGVVWRNPRSGGKQIILRKQSECIPRQMMLNKLWGIDTVWIDVFSEPFKGFPISHDRGPFLLKWTDQIEMFASDNGMVIPDQCKKGVLLDFLEYMLKCFMFISKHTLKRLINSIHVNH